MSPIPARWRASLGGWVETTADEFILRWLLRVMIIATVAVVALDYTALDARLAERAAPLPTTVDTPPSKPLPQTKRAPGSDYVPQIRVPNARLREMMSFELHGDGRLVATGAIMPGVAKAFADEVEKRGTYVKTVVLNSPGGSVQDALSMGRLIREKGFSTEVENGSYCASSCPLMFAGGVQRFAGKSAAIGVHQIFFSPSVVRPTTAWPAPNRFPHSVRSICVIWVSTWECGCMPWKHPKRSSIISDQKSCCRSSWRLRSPREQRTARLNSHIPSRATRGAELPQQFPDGLSLSGIEACISDRLLQILVHSGRIDRSGHIFVRVKEDRIVWARLPTEFLDEGLPLIEQSLVNQRRHRNAER
jgi:hypothetical protein